MQNSILKFIPFLCFIVIIFFSVNTTAQSLRYHVSKADSLFQQKRYTQSLELYQSIFAQQYYTPAMLLKMAYIEEGLDHIAPSVYYLNLYYQATKDERTLIKIKELAGKHGLEGYDFTDREQLIGKYHDNHETITYALAAIIVFLLSLMLYKKSKKSQPVEVWVGILILLMGLAFHINFPIDYATAIVARPNTYVMSGPSAGASVIRVIKEGNRVIVTGKEDVWVKVRFQDKDVYIKHDHLLPVSL